MLRTRTALLAAAAQVIERHGVRRASMADIAATAGVAKATVYNHFRAKDDVLSALAVAELDTLAGACARLAATEGLRAALEHAARAVSDHPALRRVVADEAADAHRLTAADGATRERVEAAVGLVLEAAGVPRSDERVELVRRWVSSFVCDPASPATIAATTAPVVAAITTGTARP